VIPASISSSLDGQKIQLHIENNVEDIPSGLWMVVEWQDTNTGEWYAVEGWQGTLDMPTTQTWWVGSDMLGDGLFRWRAYESENGQLLGTSQPFNLPVSIELMIVVSMSLE